MEYSLFELTWPVLVLSILGVFLEISSVKDRGINSIIFLFSSAGIIVFSVTHVSLCSDYISYQQIFASRQELKTLDLSTLVQIDGLYNTLANIWSLLVGNLDSTSSFHLFTALYQTATIVILITATYFFYPRWKNTVLFMLLFGSIQFQHIVLCGIRHGLSSSLVSLVFLVVNNVFASEEYKPNLVLLTCLVITSMFAHWQAIIILILLILFWLIRSVKIVGLLFKSKIFKSKFILGLLFSFICFLLYVFFANIISYLILPLSSILFSAQYFRIETYASDIYSGQYGGRIALTSYIDIVLIYFSLSTIRKIRKNMLDLNSKNEFSPEEKKDYDINKLNFLNRDNRFLLWTIYFSAVNLFTKVMIYYGLGTLIRVSASIYLLQILCLPFLLRNLRIRTRLFLFVLSAMPYAYFVLFVTGDRFLEIL